MAVLIIDFYIGLFGTGFIQVLYLGRAPRTKENLLDSSEKCRVTRHSRVFSRVDGYSMDPRVWSVTFILLFYLVTCSFFHFSI